MVHVFYCSSAKKLDEEYFFQLMSTLPPFFRNEILKFRKWEDRQRGLLAKCLLARALEYLNLEGKYSIENLKFTAFKRPFFDDELDFNISHSGRFTIGAFCFDKKLGIDIEEIKEIPLTDFDYEFSEIEMSNIMNSKEQMLSFYTLWTKKEAFLKAIGTGLLMPLNKIQIENDTIRWNNKSWFLKELKLDNAYVSHLCTAVDNPKIVLREIFF